MWKPTAAARKKKKLERRATTDTHERNEKAKVCRRDRGCRFPRCGCRKLKLPLKVQPEVSHDKHKGAGGNMAGDRSTSRTMVQLCRHRHQHGTISRHAGTLRAKHLTAAGYDGPVAWEIDMPATTRPRRTQVIAWRVVARETAPGILEPLADWQAELLDRLAEMEL
jgi:hypothetical protein